MTANDTSPLLDRLLSWSLKRTPSASLRFAVTTALIVTVGLVRVLLLPEIVPWLFFIPLVLAAGLLFGRATGVYASVLAAIVAGLSIGNAAQRLWLTPPQWIGSVAFVLVTSGIAFLVAELRSVFGRAQRLTTALAFERATLGALFENAPVGLSLAGATGESILINEEMRRLLGRDISRGGIDRYLGAGAIHENGSAYALHEYPQVDAIQHGVETHAAPFLVERPDGSRLRTEISSVPLRDDQGTATGAVSVVVDVEERERAIEHQTMLTGELAHRMKNTVAMVQAIVHQSLRSATTLAEARESVVSRFEALVRAQDLLTGTDWRMTDLEAVAQSALGAVHGDGQLSVDGGLVEVGARAALSFTLVLHELATNALKYGALSVPEGRVEVRWQVDPAGDDRRLSFTWKEHGGPIVAPPTRKGFGTRLIDTMGRTFGGTSKLVFDPSGVCWQVEADAAKLKLL